VAHLAYFTGSREDPSIKASAILSLLESQRPSPGSFLAALSRSAGEGNAFRTDSERGGATVKPVECPFCGAQMVKVYVMIGGGVWLSESRERIAGRIDFRLTGIPSPETEKGAPVYCCIGRSGYRVGDWPKEGFYCRQCYGFFVRS
jgi:hypothetical protein